MDKNGNNLYTGNSIHSDISYFFDKNRVESNKTTIA